MKNNKYWAFDQNLSPIFNQHIKNSIPFYSEGHLLILRLSEFFLRSNSRCYDLGTSTAKFLAELASIPKYKNVDFIGIDNSESMIEEGKKATKGQKNIQLHCSDITTYNYLPADLFIAYFTLQFCQIIERKNMLSSIYLALNPGGALILFEKVRSENGQMQDIFTAVHHDFKLDQGFTPLEILKKQNQLKGVLQPLTSAENLKNLKSAGFKTSELIMKYACFEGYLAIK